MLACFVGAQGMPAALRGAAAIPSYTFPEAAARALGHAARRWRLAAPPRRQRARARRTSTAMRRGRWSTAALAREERPWLGAEEVRAVLRAYGIAQPEGRIARTAEEAAAACAALGAPVAVKLVSRTLLHKSDVGGVRLDVRSPEAGRRRLSGPSPPRSRRTASADAMDGALVQPMLTAGVECLVGVVADPIFGPLIAFGSGGVNAEVFGDVAFRLHPLTDVDAEELIASVKVATLLRGYRGSPARRPAGAARAAAARLAAGGGPARAGRAGPEPGAGRAGGPGRGGAGRADAGAVGTVNTPVGAPNRWRTGRPATAV